MDKRLKDFAIENVGVFVKELENLRGTWGDHIINLYSEKEPDKSNVYSQAGLIYLTFSSIWELKKRYINKNIVGFKSYAVNEALSNYFYFSNTFNFIDWLEENSSYWGDTYNNSYKIFDDYHAFNRMDKDFKASILIDRWSYFYERLKNG